MERGGDEGASLDGTRLFGLVPASSCRVPPRRHGVIDREDLVKALIDADAEIIVVGGPAGYGKTTTTALWAEADRRPFAWAQLGRADADAQHLLVHVAGALDAIAPIPDALLEVIVGPGRSLDLEVVPALQMAIERMPPFVLVLDDIHVLPSRSASTYVDALVEALPDGAAIALVGRSVAEIDLARRWVSGQVFELDARELAMSDDDARRLFGLAGMDLDEPRIADLVARTEGWPAGLHLAELSLDRVGAAPGHELLSGRDRLVADYLVEEVLAALPERTVWFLERSSVLERMSAPLLDELLEIDTSGQLLRELERSGNLFLVPLDNERHWYRYHQLFGDLLRSRLVLGDPGEATSLHARASHLLEAIDDLDGAISQALAADDPWRAADLMLGQAATVVLNGRVTLLARWLDDLGPRAIEADPVAAMCAGWLGFGAGDASVLQRAIRTSRSIGDGGHGDERTRRVAPCGDLFSAIVGLGGIAETIERAGAVLVADDVDEIWMAIASALRGIARAVSGEAVAARADFVDALPALADLPMFASATRAHLALLDLHEGNAESAERLAREALEIAHREHLEGLPAIVVTFAGGALVLARSGHHEEARAEFATASELLDRLGGSVARTALVGHTLLATAALVLDDQPRARVHLVRADEARTREPDAHRLNDMLDNAHAALQVGRTAPGRPALTPAERRLLPYLTTHLAFQEIADELGITRNTVKTHAMAIYRKLGTSSRSEAVEVARDLGLLST